MQWNWKRSRFGAIPLRASILLLAVLGCGQYGPKTHAIRGTVELAGAEVKLLAGSHIEAKLTTDPNVRASGEIQEDGSFHLETIHAGTILNGAPEGVYQVRLILGDDDRKARRQAARAVAPRFLAFQTSGLTLEVPTSGEITFNITPR